MMQRNFLSFPRGSFPVPSCTAGAILKLYREPDSWEDNKALKFCSYKKYVAMTVNVSHNLQLPNQIPFPLQTSSFYLFCHNWWCSWTWHPTSTAILQTQKDSAPSKEDVPHRKALTQNGRGKKLRPNYKNQVPQSSILLLILLLFSFNQCIKDRAIAHGSYFLSALFFYLSTGGPNLRKLSQFNLPPYLLLFTSPCCLFINEGKHNLMC